MVTAHCTWGDGSDVMLFSERGEEKQFFDLRKDEAIELHRQLGIAIYLCEQYDKSLDEYFKQNPPPYPDSEDPFKDE